MADLHFVLWTGGWDSTFRVTDLVMAHGRRVQPVYVRDPQRRTAQRELDTMARQVELMEERRPGSAALVQPVLVLDLADLPRDPEITEAGARVATQLAMYAQYHWLPHVPCALGRDGVELCWQDDGTFAYFPRAAYVRTGAEAPDDWFVLDPQQCDPDRYAMFRRFRFPLIATTKPAMAELARARGFLPVLEASWTCRWPTILGNPCGFCTPCQETRDEGLGDRVPRPTRMRHAVHRTKWTLVRHGDQMRIRARAAGESLRAAMPPRSPGPHA